MSAFFNRRAFISLIVFIFFSVILITSILMFINPHTPLVALVHTGVGFSLLVALAWHLKNNFASLKQYFRWRQSNTGKKMNLAMPAALVLGLLVLGLALTKSIPFLSFYEWGNQLRADTKETKKDQFTYLRADKIQAEANGNKFVIDLRKGPYFRWPQYAIWLETLEGKFIQPLFVTEKLAHNGFINKVSRRNQQVFNEDISDYDDQTFDKMFSIETRAETAEKQSRPESLPVFLHQLATSQSSQEKMLGVDGFAGATLFDNFLLSVQAQNPLPTQYRVRLEINQSFDFNQYYSSDRFPDDPVYSGDGYSAQPSVIYEAVIDTLSPQDYYPMTLIGHGHHSGQDGKVDTDLNNLTTAKQLIDRIIIEVQK